MRMPMWLAYLIYDEGGFLGFGGGDRKKSYRSVQEDARNMRQKVLEYQPQYTSNRLGINAYQNAQNNENPNFPRISQGWNALMDSPMRPDQTYNEGYMPGEIEAAKAGARASVAGGRTAAMRNINRNINAQGMGSTGAGIRSIQALEPTWTQQATAAQRDVDIAAADARRTDYQKNQDRIAADYWKGIATKMDALQGLNTYEQGRESFNRNAFNDERAALNDETGLFDTAMRTYGPELDALGGMYRPGNWSRLGQRMIESLGTWTDRPKDD